MTKEKMVQELRRKRMTKEKMVKRRISVEAMWTQIREISRIQTLIRKDSWIGKKKTVGISGKDHVEREIDAGTGM